LGVEAGGEQEERFVGEGETVPPFVDATLAENDRLPPRGERVTNDLPFLESDGVGHLKRE
jgi:hypothetical protein